MQPEPQSCSVSAFHYFEAEAEIGVPQIKITGMLLIKIITICRPHYRKSRNISNHVFFYRCHKSHIYHLSRSLSLPKNVNV